MDIRRAFTFMTEDPDWVRKLAIAMLLNVPSVALIALGFLHGYGLHSSPLYDLVIATAWWPLVSGLVSVPLSGFSLRIVRNVITGHDELLPAWSEVGGILKDGLMLWGVNTLWYLPVTILDWLRGSFVHIAEPLSNFSLVLSLLVMLVLPAAQARLAAKSAFRAGIEVPAVVRVFQANAGGYVLLLILPVLVTVSATLPFIVVAALLLGSIADPMRRVVMSAGLGFVLAMLFVFPYLIFVLSHLTGQVYLRAVSRLSNAGRAMGAA